MDTMAEHVSLARTQIRLPSHAAAATEPSSEARPSVGQAAGGAERPRPMHPSGHAILTDQEIRDLERQNLVRALEVCGWRIQGAHGAAELLGVRPSTLRDRMRSFGIHRPA